jgi:hypothetical protein
MVTGTHAAVLPLADANRDVNKMVDYGPYLTKQRAVDIDLSGLGGVRSVSFPAYLLEVFGDFGFALEVKLPDGELRFSVMAAKYVARHILGEEIDVARVLSVPDVNSYIREYGIDTEVVVRLAFVEPNALSAAQRGAIGSGGRALDVSLSYKGGEIKRYDGAIEITAPYTGVLPVNVWHLGDLGNEEQIACSYDGGRVRFNALRLSYFTLSPDPGRTDARAFAEPANLRPLPFADVGAADWFYEDVLWAYANGFAAYAANFRPGNPMTRAMLVTMLWRMDGRPSAAFANPFTDVGYGDWFYNSAVWAAGSGVVSDRTGPFSPNAFVTRQEFAAMILNYAVHEGRATPGGEPPVLAFADAASIDDYAAPGVAWCYENGIVQGRPGRIFDPQAVVSRAEMAALLHRYAAL